MKYYVIKKNKKKLKSKNKLKLENGYSFKKAGITIYENGMINYILKKKIDNQIKRILNLYLNNDDDESNSKIINDIELLRKLILNDYIKYMPKKKIKEELYKLDTITKNINEKRKVTKVK